MWPIISGVTAIVSLAFAVFVFAHGVHRRRLEDAKSKALAQNLESTRLVTLSALEATNLIVQRAKDSTATVAELQNMARVIRGQLHVVASSLEKDEQTVSRWRYGKSVESLTTPVPERDLQPTDRTAAE